VERVSVGGQPYSNFSLPVVATHSNMDQTSYEALGRDERIRQEVPRLRQE